MSQRPLPTAITCRDVLALLDQYGDESPRVVYRALDVHNLLPWPATARALEEQAHQIAILRSTCIELTTPSTFGYIADDALDAIAERMNRRPYCAGIALSALVVVLGWCVLAWVFGPLFGMGG